MAVEESQPSLTHLLAAALTRKKLQSGDVRATRKRDRNRGRRTDRSKRRREGKEGGGVERGEEQTKPSEEQKVVVF